MFYRQKHGGAIGSPVCPVVTDIYVENFEVKALQSFSGVIPRVWWRYVDDTFVVLIEGMCEKLFNHINSVDEFHDVGLGRRRQFVESEGIQKAYSH